MISKTPDHMLALEALSCDPQDPAEMLDGFACELALLEHAVYAEDGTLELTDEIVRHAFSALERRMRVGAEALRRQYAREQATAPASELRAVGGAR